VEEIEDYARERGLLISVKPNGTMTTTMVVILMDYFAARAGMHVDWRKVTRFLNNSCKGILDSSSYPTAYLVCLDRPEAKAKSAGQAASAAG
jgi:hypothetical protein